MGGTTFALGCPCNRFKIKWIEFFRPLNLAKASAPMQFWSTASTRRPKGWGAAACDLNVADLDFSPAQREANKSVPGKIRQQLQVLRDLNLLEFLGSGSYRLR